MGDEDVNQSRAPGRNNTSSASAHENHASSHDVNLHVRETELVQVVDRWTVPKDSGYAWVCVVAAFFDFFLVLGAFKSFGVIFVELRTQYPGSETNISWVFTFSLFLGFCMSPIVTGLGLRYGNRTVNMVGGVVACLQYVTSAFAPSVTYLFFTYGVLGGISLALCYSPPIVALGYYFEKRRTLANGIAVAGSGVGNFVLPPLFRFLFNEVGFRNGMIIIGAIVLHVCVCGALLRPPDFYKKPERFCKKNLHDANCQPKKPIYTKNRLSPLEIGALKGQRTRSVSESSSVACRIEERGRLDSTGSRGWYTSLNKRRHLSDLAFPSTGGLDYISTQSIPDLVRAEQKAGKTKAKFSLKEAILNFWYIPTPGGKKRPLIDYKLLLNPLFLIYCLSAFFSTCGYNNMFIAIPTYADDNNISKENGAILLSLLGIMDLVGRIGFGFLFDLNFLKKRYGYLVTMSLGAGAAVGIAFLPHFVPLAVLSSLYGLFGGAFIALIPVMLIEALGAAMLPSAYGLLLVAQGLATLSVPILGRVRVATGTWQVGFLVVAASMLIGALLVLLEPVAKGYLKRRGEATTDTPSADREAQNETSPMQTPTELNCDKV